MKTLVVRYEARKRACPAPGIGKGFHQKSFGVARAGAEAGIDQNTVFEDLREIADRGNREVPDSEINATVDNAYAVDSRHSKPAIVPAIPGELTFQRITERGESFLIDDLRRASPIHIPDEPVEQAHLLLSALYSPSDRIFIGERFESHPRRIRPVADYLRGDPTFAPHIIGNPLTGNPAPCKGGSKKMTHRGDNNVASFRFALFEFDHRPTDEQVHFFAGVDWPIACIIDSGRVSLHAWLAVNINSAEEWEEIVRPLYHRYLIPLGADPSCCNPSRLSRMPGHCRSETKRRQELLFLDPEARGPCYYLTQQGVINE